MKKIEADYSQQWLLPASVEDWVGESHPARFIREVVSGMDLEGLGFREHVAEEGRPPYSNRLLLRLWLFGYWERIRSSRKLEKACRRDLAFIWLCGNNPPDHNTLWRFFRDNKAALRGVFRRTVKVAIEMDLVGLALQAVDGTKIQAACSGRDRFDRTALAQLLERLNAQIAELEAGIEAENRRESTEEPGLPERLRRREELRARVAEALRSVEVGETRHCQPSEPDARRMKCEGRNRFAHNAQAVVDSQAQVIVASDVVNDAGDCGQLAPMLDEAVANTGSRVPVTLADAGYASAEQFQAAEDRHRQLLAPLPPASADSAVHRYHASQFRYDEAADAFICPEGRSIPFQRERVSRTGTTIRVYRSVRICRDCPVREACTQDRHGRTIDLQPGRAAMERMRLRLRDERNRQLLRRRSCIVEPVFAQIKHNDGFRRWMVRGLDGVRAQWALLCSTWNLRKIYVAWLATRPRKPAAAAAHAPQFVAPPPPRAVQLPAPGGWAPCHRSFAGVFTRSSHPMECAVAAGYGLA